MRRNVHTLGSWWKNIRLLLNKENADCPSRPFGHFTRLFSFAFSHAPPSFSSFNLLFLSNRSQQPFQKSAFHANCLSVAQLPPTYRLHLVCPPPLMVNHFLFFHWRITGKQMHQNNQNKQKFLSYLLVPYTLPQVPWLQWNPWSFYRILQPLGGGEGWGVEEVCPESLKSLDVMDCVCFFLNWISHLSTSPVRSMLEIGEGAWLKQ